MAKLTFLGTASAVPSRNQHNSHFVIETGDYVLLIDCAGNPVVRLEEAGIDPLSITDLVLTHFHPDHVSGAPLLLMDLWLMGRQDPIRVYGLDEVMDKLEKMMGLFNWEDWEGFYPVQFIRIPPSEMAPLIMEEKLKVWGSQVCHMIPAMGLRFEIPEFRLAYSSDTGPCAAVVRLADKAEILIHEASGSSDGHSSAAEAGMIATRAGVKKLILIHYPPRIDPELLVAEAQSTFSGDVIVAEDLVTLSF